jgi:hypothetical protein
MNDQYLDRANALTACKCLLAAKTSAGPVVPIAASNDRGIRDLRCIELATSCRRGVYVV